MPPLITFTAWLLNVYSGTDTQPIYISIFMYALLWNWPEYLKESKYVGEGVFAYLKKLAKAENKEKYSADVS